MKKQFRILAAALALCLSLLCCPAAFAAVDSSSCPTGPYAQAMPQPLGSVSYSHLNLPTSHFA